MSNVRRRNQSCVSCGAGTPMDVVFDGSGSHREYCCASCGDTIVQGIVAQDNNIPDANLPPSLHQSVVVGDNTRWRSIEVWWSEYSSCGIIHGRKVSGSQEVYDLLQKVRDIHDSK